ncbi:MAG: transglutaminase domain-containing protein [Myxococcales bacterium]|nr:transglutaminase domain-containing protein [Myxococcales bacterium]
MSLEAQIRTRVALAAVAFALAVPAVILALQGGVVAGFGIVLGLLALIGARTGGGGELPVWVQLILQGAVAATCAVGLSLVGDVPQGKVGPYVTVGFLGAALPRLWQKVDPSGRSVTLGLGLLALMGMARAVPRAAFGIAVAAYLAAGLLATLAADRSAPSLLRHPRGALAPFVGALLLAAGVMGGLGWSLPAAEPAVSKVLQDYLFDGKVAESGFGEGRVNLGDLTEIVTSDAVAMRVFGAADHLRGMVYVDYAHGQWAARRRPDDRPERGDSARIPLGAGPAKGEAFRVEAEHDAGRAFFAPLGAAAVLDAPVDARLDAYGVPLFPNRLLTDARTWRVEPGPVKGRRIAAPDEHDLAVPRGIRGELMRLSGQWARGAVSQQDTVESLTRHLQRAFAYSLKLDEVPSAADPTLFFLTQSRRGHCEYFASALALLARSQGIPARLVTGYRVFEFSSAGGYHIVRKRDAHAWVEVFLDGAWRTVDPTPPGVLEGESARTSGWWRARWDMLARAFTAFVERLSGLTPLELMAVAVILAVLALAWVGVRRRRPPRPLPEAFEPLALVEARVAAQRGPLRAPSEPLLRFAERLAAEGFAEAAALVVRCAHHRYGGQGELDGLLQAARAFAARRLRRDP